MGGKSVFRILDGDANLKVVLETLTADGTLADLELDALDDS